MKFLLPVTITLFSLLLIGCEEESDVYPEDGRNFDAEGYIDTKPYVGRVMNGYLKNARVWLDIDGNGQYTPGPLTIENEAGTELVLTSGEPTGMSGQDGRFELDISQLEQDPLISADLDPKDYPLFAVVLPGQTLEQTDAGDQVLDNAFMMSSPPGVRNVTPLTTLARQRQVNGLFGFLSGTTELALALGNVNLVSDYVLSGDVRAQAYAKAFGRFLSSQLPSYYKEILADGDGLQPGLSADAVRLMGISFARNALEIVQAVDSAAVDGDYSVVDVEALELPDVDLELEDNEVVVRQTVFARASDELPESISSLEELAELSFNYSESGRLTSIETNGCMKPELSELVRLINANGRIADTDVQWVPTITLNQISGTFYDEEGVDERLSFDWENGTAAFETTTTCHGSLASTSELGGEAAIAYDWSMANGRVDSITAISDSKTEILKPDYTGSSDTFLGFTRTVNGIDREVVAFSSAPQSCEADIADEDLDEPLVVSATQNYSISGEMEIPSALANVALELDLRDGFNRPLRYGFQDEGFQGTAGVVNSGGFQWQFYYPTTSQDRFIPDQPNLIDSAYLKQYQGEDSCGRAVDRAPFTGYARVAYSYQKFSEYLAGLVQ
ncbi:hypothetical protein [Marinobacter sp. CHS3-4]|uniref:hypothetical protein n=1 Tax=Marinobacter sp. CHS3-4 TaxID=3045174 RepID=UPI0024B50999|nr:hypothetical protein [Marinobacter sp. CHS3-4]MDI9246210.1 hypothetical protein [Marinobacter sp. CHS3-4]